MVRKIEIIGLKDFPEIKPGDDIGEIIVEHVRKLGIEINDGDVIVIAQKIVSKSEGRIIDLDKINNVTEEALEISANTGKDPRLVQLILNEALEVLKVERGHIITLTRHGIVCADSGIDFSNVNGSGRRVTLLPTNPDISARRIRSKIMELTGKKVAVIITDTYGRPFREGVVNMCIGFAGIEPFKNYIGQKDRYGYIFKTTKVCIVDEIAAAAELIMGQGSEGIPVIIIRGLNYQECEECSLRDIIMPKEKWLFR
ncbi:MAG: coenzyme F420-0:L-glutamate ligase [Thermoprotei archaeon ex4572_64]|nr:MAG: coenzyme F420-0:L-glutamate ligase [Thermoprotei archaeon ex4572_64]